ncbi:MAG: hypothetical protein HY447_04760 [Candidatus Omnitrophica bacterium]|nr:hypothetical protein [Candidatus Omnitrophota bacterium]
MGNKYLFTILFILGVTLILGFRFGNRVDSPVTNSSFLDLASHPTNPAETVALSENEIYIRDIHGKWNRVLFFEGGTGSSRKLILHPHLQDRAFVVTEKELFEIDLRKGRSKLIYNENRSSESRIYSFAIHPAKPTSFYLGTNRGLLISRDEGKSWLSPYRWPENQSVQLVDFLSTESPLLFLATERELFFSKDDGETFESGFSLPLFSEEELESLMDNDSDEFEETLPMPRFTSVTFSSKEPHRIWVGTLEGVYETRDGGISWEKLPDSGLRDKGIADLVYSDRLNQLIAASPSGVFRFLTSTRRWEDLSIGTTRPSTSMTLRYLKEKDEEVLLVVSGGEVYESILTPFETPFAQPSFIPSPERMDLLRKIISLEPAIREVQRAAIRYGNLGNTKIKRWHLASRLRALIPDLSFGKDFSLSENVDIDRGSTNEPDRFIVGPQEGDKGWDFGVNWELGDLLYSTAQTSIDSRAKLLVELRESILSQVTRIYFERRRIQMQLFLLTSAAPSQEYFDLLLRVDELTAQIDALTDGFFSHKLDEIYKKYPELSHAE